MSKKSNHRRLVTIIITIVIAITICGVGALYSLSNNNTRDKSMNAVTANNTAIIDDNNDGVDNSADDTNNALDNNDVTEQNGNIVENSNSANNNKVTSKVTTTIAPDASTKIDDIVVYEHPSDNNEEVNSERAKSEFSSHPDTGHANMLAEHSEEIANLTRYAFERMDWGTLKHTDVVTRQDGGLTYLTRTYTGMLTDGRNGELTVDIIYETDTNKLVYALLTSFQATERLPSGGTKVEDMLVSGI